jgi:hypothetical protein
MAFMFFTSQANLPEDLPFSLLKTARGDVAGGIYGGRFTVNEKAGLIDGTLKLTMPAEKLLVTGASVVGCVPLSRFRRFARLCQVVRVGDRRVIADCDTFAQKVAWRSL